ncbi:MAG: ABC transporter ATP-binding protein [Gorillibacterium sp.]|nr:ABC transporter ATP-binding protein [Gorillibacterium sp.]
MIELKQLHKSIGEQVILKQISLTIKEGSFFGIIGPNGSGKSTLIGLVAGIDQPDSGDVLLDGRPIQAYSRKELARFLAVLPQEGLQADGFTVREVLEMGRFPYQNWFGGEEEDSSSLIDGIMERLSIRHLEERLIEHLSGGERQRVALGKTMVQEPRVLLLDEPTTFLDIGYQIQLMDYIREWQMECGLTVIAVLHDLNLAAQYCERLMLMNKGTIAFAGEPEEIMDAELIAQVYGTRPLILAHPQSGIPQILLQPGVIGINKRMGGNENADNR